MWQFREENSRLMRQGRPDDLAQQPTTANGDALLETPVDQNALGFRFPLPALDQTRTDRESARARAHQSQGYKVVLLLGPPGAGKTHLTICLIIAAAQRRCRACCGTTIDLIILGGNSGGNWSKVLGDEVMAAALIDHLLHQCHPANVRGNVSGHVSTSCVVSEFTIYQRHLWVLGLHLLS